MATTDIITPPATDRGSRLHGLDAMRGGALLLGIVLHSLLPFALGGFWLVNDKHSNSAVAGIVVHLIHLFRMPLFLLLAGYFARMVWYRKGARAFVVDRLKRIGLPLIAFWPVAVGSLGALIMLNVAVNDAPLPVAPGAEDQPQLPGPGQLWFLLVLLQCYLIMIGIRALLRAVLGRARAGAISQRAATVLSSPAGVLLAALPYAVGVLLQGEPISGGLREPVTFLPEPRGLVAYFGAFAVGWALHARPDALSRVTRGRWVYLAVGLLAAAGSVLLSAPTAGGKPVLPAVITAAVAGVASWTLIYALLGLGLRFLNVERPAIRYLADASYWMYLLHLPLLVAIEIPLVALDWPIMIKLLITWVAAFTVLLLSYHLLVRSTWVGKWLNGRRHPWTWPPLRSRTRGAENPASSSRS